jgi:hypothetical protein
MQNKFVKLKNVRKLGLWQPDKYGQLPRNFGQNIGLFLGKKENRNDRILQYITDFVCDLFRHTRPDPAI